MTRHMKAKRSTALILSAAMLATSLAPALPVYAKDGWTETQFLGNPVYKVLQDFSFSSEANAQALAAGSIPTGLSHNLTFTRHVPPYEPYAYGKYWLGNERGQAVTNAKVPLASGSGNVTIDFSQIGNHFISCIQNHNGGLPGGAIPGIEGVGYLDVYSSQWFAIEAFLPTDNPKDYPQYIQNSFASDPDAINQMKFYLILMSLLHSYDNASEPDLKDDRNQTEYSAFLYAYTRALENGHMAAKPQTADQAFAIVAAEEVGLFRDTYGADFYDQIFSETSPVKGWFTNKWNDAVFMSQFTYSTMDVNGDAKVAVSIPLAPAAMGAGGQYERVWDYSAQTNTDVKNMNAGLKLKGSAPGPGGITVRTENDKLILSAATAEALDDANLSGYIFTTSTLDGSESKIQPAGLVSGRPARVAVDAKSLMSGAEGQPMFASFSMDVELRVGSTTTTIPDDPTPSEDSIIRYKHTETFKADYTVNLRKFDSETGQPLENSHWDILENFPDYESQLGATVLEGEDNWANDTGTQFEKWEEWEEDPCSLDDNVTNSEGILTYNGSGETAHTDTKLYTYIKGFCGGHPAKPEPEEDPETGEILNQDEIDAWEEEVETCKALLAEGGYFCATAQKGYENGEDASGEESKKQMEDDRDKYYGQFISLYYDYSAEEIQARPGYTIHGTHTDDIPIETKTVTSSQYKDFQKACSGNVENLPHQAAAGTGASESLKLAVAETLRVL